MYSLLCFLVSFLFKDVGNNGFKTLYNFGFCYGCTIAMMYINMMPILLAFPMTMKYLKREHFNHWYGLRPYYTALVISRLPVTIFFSAMFILVTYYFTDQPLEVDRMLKFLSICLMLALISETIGIVISSSLNVVNAVFTGPASVVPMMLLAVYGIGSGPAPIPLMWRIARSCSFLRYGLEGLMAAVYSPPRNVIPCPDEEDFCMFSKVPFFLEMMGMKDVSYWEDITVLIAMWVGFNFLAFYLIRQRVKPNKAFRMLRYLGQFIKQKMNDCQQS